MNDKSIVVINTPKNCRVCPFRQSPWTFCLGEYEKEKHCPLRPLPQRYDEGAMREQKGWNRCLDEILGETE